MSAGAIQTVWAEVLVASFGDAGVREVVVSPGSRSTPIAAAIAGRGRLRVHVVIDERAAGFFALGRARADGAPVALVCTSGTAVAHYVPAVIEAAMAGVPLVVVSADRPPELQGAGASQTIDQVRLFGEFVRRFDDLGPPEGTPLALRALRRKVAQAVAAARGPVPGPVHLNVPLRKPLEPVAADDDAARACAAEAARLCETVIVRGETSVRVPDEAVAEAAAMIAAAPRGVIVATAGPTARRGARGAAFELALRAGYPMLAEAGSQLRFAPRPGEVAAIDRFGLVCGSPLARDLVPDLIVQIGGEPVAMSWAGFAARAPRRLIIAEHGWPDGDSSASLLLIGDVADTLARIAAALSPARARIATSVASGWVHGWLEAERVASRAMDEAIRTVGGEAAMVAAAIAAVPEGGQLMLGNSLPIRIADEVAGGGRDLTVITQRGAAGIDGLIAGAAGAAAAGTPTVLILGDVSFAHDAGALTCARGLPLAIVVIDNQGGRIFDELPVAKMGLDASDFDRLWTTPPGLDPAAVARGFGIAATSVRTADDLTAAIARVIAGDGPIVIHAPVAPDSARAARAHLWRST